MTGSAQKTTLDNAALNTLDKEVTHIRYEFLRHQLTLSLELIDKFFYIPVDFY